MTKIIKIEATQLANWFYNSGSDQEQEALARDLGYRVVEALVKGEEFSMFPQHVMDELADASMIPVAICEGFDKDDDRELGDLDYEFDIELIY